MARELLKPSQMVYFIMQNIGFQRVTPYTKYVGLQYFLVASQTILLFVFFISNTMFIIVDDSSFLEVKTEPLECALAVIHVISKHFNIMLRGRFLKKMVDEMDQTWEELKSVNLLPGEFHETEKKVRQCILGSVAFFLFPLPVRLIESIFLNWNKSDDEFIGIAPLWTPFPQSWRLTIYIFQMTICISILLGLCTCSSLMFTLTEYVALYIRILQYMLKTRTGTMYGSLPFRLHQRVIKKVQYINEFLSAQIFLEFALNSLELAATLFAFIMAVNRGELPFSFLLLTMVSIATPFSLSLCATKITTEGDLILQAAYDNTWYEEDEKRKSELKVFMTCASKPLIIHYRCMITFGMEQFTAFCKGVYTSAMLLQFWADYL